MFKYLYNNPSKQTPVKNDDEEACDFNPLPDDKILDWCKIVTNCRRHFKVQLK